MNLETLGKKYARLTTDAVVRRPMLWRLFRPLMRLQFDRMAKRWDVMRMEGAYGPFEAALERVEPPRRVLDVGTGTGEGAFAAARRFPEAEVVGADVAGGMIDVATAKVPAELRDRVRFEVADAANLPFGEASFDLVTHGNMIPFFDEVARVLAPGGYALFAFSGGDRTPIYVPFDRLRSELERRGFTDFAELSAGNGTAVVARKRGRT
jgi:SAM-dependent methyltransferase